MTLHGDAEAGVLTQAALDGYLRICKIDDPSTEIGNGTNGFTALAIAAQNGHIGVVRLLLDNNANVNALSTQYHTPLWTVTARGRGESRAEIVEVLLKQKANPKYSHADLRDGSTPLVNELKQLKDIKVIQLLVVADGTTDAATILAADIGDPAIDDAMKSNRDRTNLRAAFVALVIALIRFILALANSINLTGIDKGNKILIKFQISMAKKVAPEVSERKTKEDFKRGIENFVDKHELGKFYPKGDNPLLEKIVSKAFDLQNDDKSILGEPTNTENLVKFSLYQPVIYCDDSSSMSEKGKDQTKNRMVNQKDLVQRIASICTKVVPDHLGVHLRFINNPKDPNDVRLDDVKTIMSSIKAEGSTKIGTHLQERILGPLVYNTKMTRPIFVSIITDGVADGETENTLKEKILDCQKKLSEKNLPPRAVVFQISQIGSDHDARNFLDGLIEDNRLKGSLYVTTKQLDAKYEDLRKNEKNLEAWLFQTLLTPVLGMP